MSELATSFLRKILRSWEKNQDRKQRAFAVDYGKFASTIEEDEFFHVLKPLFVDGSLEPIRGKGGINSRIEHIRLLTPASIYMKLNIEPLHERSANWSTILSQDAEAWERPVIEAIHSDWMAERKWLKKFGPSDIGAISSVQKLARAIRTGQWQGTDHRTFCARVVDDSKFIETRGAAVFAYCYHGQDKPGDSTRSIIAALGLEKSGVPVLVSGPFSLAGLSIGEMVDYVGVSDKDLVKVALTRQPKYLLTIENRESFHRHSVEINQNRDGLILFTGGQPSSNVQILYAALIKQIDEKVPVFHWSDIDYGGLEIYSALHRICSRLKPHLMSPDLAIRFGRKPDASLKVLVDKPWPEPVSELAAYLATDSARIIEQEILDPSEPEGIQS